jgi:nicotinate-nucleotide adenylyltransferase
MAVKPSARRVGVYGGAFDPPHNTHLALARAALAQAGLSELRILPTGQAWHKAHVLSPAEDRLAMTRLAFAGLPGAVVDARETRRSGPTYTLDTLRELRAEQPDAQFVLLMGADQAQALPMWHGWQDILQLATILVADRPDGAWAGGQFDPENLPDQPADARFEHLPFALSDLSATDIRARAARGDDIAALVPPAVARYIDQHHLYRPA